MEEYDCSQLIDCSIEEPGCAERMWTHEQYCTGKKVGVVQIGQPIHVPEETGIVLPWTWYWGLGFVAGVILVVGVCLLVRNFRK